MTDNSQSKKTTRLIIIVVMAFVIIIFGAVRYFGAASNESSDNAQLDGDILQVRSAVTAYVSDIRFKDNQIVKKGDTLLVFNSVELQTKRIQAEALLENARANLVAVQKKASSSNSNARASVQTAEASQQNIILAKIKLEKSQKDFDRILALQKIKAVTQQQVDNAQSDLQTAKSEYQKTVNQQQSAETSALGSKAQSGSDKEQISLARAQIKQREADVALASNQLSYAAVIAPFSGIVSRRTVTVGQYVSAGQSLCAIVSNEKFWISANLKETQLKNISIGDKVEISIDAYPELKLTGKVESFSGATGAKFSLLPPDNATGNFIKIVQRFPLRISIDNFPKDKSSAIFPGLSAFVKITTK